MRVFCCILFWWGRGSASSDFVILLFLQVSVSCSDSVPSNSENPGTVARQAPLSMGILQARILEWVAMSSSRGSSQPKDQTQVSLIAGGFLTLRVTREAHEYWNG